MYRPRRKAGYIPANRSVQNSRFRNPWYNGGRSLWRKKGFRVAVGAFTVASMLCSLAASREQTVVFRPLQGIFAAPLAPMSQSVLSDSYPKEPHGCS